MKKWIAVLLCVSLLFTLAACGEKPAAPVTEPEPAAEPEPITEPELIAEPEPAPVKEDDGVIRILGVGNSWMRDSLRWVAGIAQSAGKKVVVGHAYLGASTLFDQYFGMHSSDYTYNHDGYVQKVHSTYQYWKYSVGSNPVKKPSSGYSQSNAYAGVTLESVVSDEPWDYILFLNTWTYSGSWDGWVDPEKTVVCDGTWPGDTAGTVISWDIADFIDDLVELLPEGTDRPVIGMEIPWSPAQGNTSTLSAAIVEHYNGGVQPKNQQERDEMYVRAHEMIQDTAAKVQEYLGEERCAFTVNAGLALKMAREQEELLGFGYKLQRAKNNTHLADGLPMYLSGMTVANAIFGFVPEDVTWFPTVAVDDLYHTAAAKAEPTAELAETVRRIAAEANRQPLK